MDTRRLFTKLSRKADNWGSICSINASPEQLAALAAMPVAAMPNFDPLDHKFGATTGLSCEFVGIHAGEVFYINTEGYDYPRYMARIANAAPADFPVTHWAETHETQPYVRSSTPLAAAARAVLNSFGPHGTPTLTQPQRDALTALAAELNK